MESLRKLFNFLNIKNKTASLAAPQRARAVEVINQAINSRDNIKIELDGEEFNTWIIHLDNSGNFFIADSIMPKYGDDRLVKNRAYHFKQNHLEDGIISQLEFIAVYQQPVKFDGIPAHIFSLPHEIIRKSSISEIKPKPKDNIRVRIRYDLREYNFKVSRMNIQTLHFTDSDGELDIPNEGVSIDEGYIQMPAGELKVSGTLHQETKYGYRLELKTISAKDRLIMGEYIENEFRVLSGFERRKYPAQHTPAGTIRNSSESLAVKQKILMVNDDEDSVDHLSKALNSKEFQCVVYNDSEKLVENVLKQKPKLVILSGPDALVLLQKLKKQRITSGIPVVIFSQSASAEDVLEASEAGAAHYFIKSPDLDMDEFISKIESLI